MPLAPPKNMIHGEHVSIWENWSWVTNLKEINQRQFFSLILFVDEKENLGKGPLCCKGDLKPIY
jgi:hypothetical protein